MSLTMCNQYKDRMQQLRAENKDTNLDSKLLYLAFYGDPEEMSVSIIPDSKDDYISILWIRKGKFFMNGALVKHEDSWSVHT